MANRCWEIREAGNKGVGIFSTEEIPARTLIFTESPLLIIPKPGWCTTFMDGIAAHEELSTADKQRFAELRTVLDMPNRDVSNLDLDFSNPHVMT